MHRTSRYLAFLIAALWAISGAQAQSRQTMVQFSAGTGFFINREGNLITNAHVVKNCQATQIMVDGKLKPVRIVAKDETGDLAVLASDMAPSSIASLRWNISDLSINDTLYLYGFPGSEGAKGKPTFSVSKLIGMQGPTGEPQWLQLKSTAQQGNSGGPVLDGAGNVIAVIAGRAETYRVSTSTGGKPQLLSRSDIAITLAALQDFLDDNQIPSYRATSGSVAYSTAIIQQNASRFVVPVRCIHSTVTQ